jgi:hypothetical protein
MWMYGPTGIVSAIEVLPHIQGELGGPLVLADLPVADVIVLEQQERAEQLQRPYETRRC